MRTLAKVLLLFCGAYALDFLTSALFIALGYGYAETNLAQRALFASPGLGTVASWAANQDVRIGLLVLGVAALSIPGLRAERFHLNLIIGVGALLCLYGAATNVAFLMQAVAGVSFPLLGLYALLSGLALIPFAHGKFRQT